ncbi:helix-turn-helix domain-containing protein [Oceanobacillus polygoni]|uniref:Transcriptional regulator with XRE-family HTH domain n=1 Tax=Oceanobacillus polygoni TaxID=1235259 RepID=A0A9X0YRD3_9BACI|nr:helix-turn-helix domain-containing protein [Oceanobacillus polygoni]MBP2075869.1 transcriptional regulator with XRE-family HTH domain [Oceanobacillus polygoni]
MEEYSQVEIGKKIRDMRLNKNISINKVSKITGLTPSFISQFERGLTSASIDSIIKLADAIDVKLTMLFSDNVNQESQSKNPVIIRKSERPSLSSGSTNNMLEYLLTHPDSKLEVYLSKLNPGASTSSKFSNNGVDEFLLILEGKLEIEVENVNYVLSEGDTMTMDGSLSKSWENSSDSVTTILWIYNRA